MFHNIANNRNSLTHFISLSTLFLLLFLSCCTQEKLKNLDSNKCNRCKKYLNGITKLKPSTYSTKTLNNLGNQSQWDGVDWEKSAKKKFENKRKINAVSEKEYSKLVDNIHCLIGLDKKSVLRFFSNDFDTHKVETDSTLKLTVMVETIRRKSDMDIVWTGTKACRLYFQKKSRECIFVGSERQKSIYKKCISQE